MIRYSDIVNISQSEGFDACGVARPQLLTSNTRRLKEWIDAGNVASLDYMCRNIDKREDITQMVEGAKSVIVCAVSYKSDVNSHYTSSTRGKIASYACNGDYHKTIKKMLLRMLSSLKELYPDVEGRAFVDSAPIFEKQYAVNAGLGWIGRQSLLVSPTLGTYILLGELVINCQVDRYDKPIEEVGCAECRRCVEACPNGAINADRTIDARRCISCQTIEQRNVKGIDLHGWIFGCDECQMCCPYNQKAPNHKNPNFNPLFSPNAISPEQWLTMSEEEFECRFGKTPLKRSGLQRIQYNLNKE